MAQIQRPSQKGNTATASAVPFRAIGAIPLGDGANLTVQIGTSGGSRVVNLRNETRQGPGAMLPVGVGALVGADQLPDLIRLLQQAHAGAAT